jgi:hypothetical protein
MSLATDQLRTALKTFRSVPLLRRLRRRSPRPPKSFIVSFPKCGRTWLRLMMGYAIAQHFELDDAKLETQMLELDALANLDERIPYILAVHDDHPQWKQPQELEHDKSSYTGKRVILLVRDPRDVVVSCYFEHKKRVGPYLEDLKKQADLQEFTDRLKPYDGDLSDYLHEDVGSIDTVIEYYNIWAENRHVPDELLLVRYEDLHADAPGELKRMLDFVGLPQVKPAVIQAAVDYAAFDNMRKMEQENRFASFKLRPTDSRDSESYKTRKGKVGGFAEYLSSAEIEALNRQIRARMSDFYRYRI